MRYKELSNEQLKQKYNIKEIGGGTYGEGFYTALKYFDYKHIYMILIKYRENALICLKQ
jgi:hypothetical protein